MLSPMIPPPVPPSLPLVPVPPEPALPVLKPIPGERIGRWLATIVILLIAAMQIISVFRGGKSDAVAEGPTKVSAQEVIAGKIVLAKNVLGKLAPTPVPQDELEQLAKSAQTPQEKFRLQLLRWQASEQPISLNELPAELPATDRQVLQAWLAGQTPIKEDLELFEDTHGWYAKLVRTLPPLSNEEVTKNLTTEAMQVLTLLSGAMLLGMGAFITGLVLFILFLAKKGWRQPMVWVGPPAGRGGPFYEGFSIFLVSLVGMQDEQVGGWGIFGVILGLLWPLLRGISWSEFRLHLGLFTNKGFWRDCFYGWKLWLMALPSLAVLMVVSTVLSAAFDLKIDHPINEAISSDGDNTMIFLLAVVFAPVMEELSFRGLLLSGLRSRWSFVVSALITSVLFAAIHPQGLAAIPVLGGLAFVFAYARATRGSIVPPMAMHALHNGLLTLALVLLI
jgi:membrane protease YdiL (CAAX protease family)